MFIRISFIVFIIHFAFLNKVAAQITNADGKIVMGAIVVGGDTLPHTYLPMLTVMDQEVLAMNDAQRRRYYRKRKKARRRYSKLKRNVYKTYPYAVMAGYTMHDIDSAMLTIRSKDAQKIYKRQKEKELSKRYKGQLENLTMSQGRVLVILIARQTGKDCYTIIKDLKGGFNARMWQTLASLFANNLKRSYQPEGKDATIESICQEIEASGRFVRSN